MKLIVTKPRPRFLPIALLLAFVSASCADEGDSADHDATPSKHNAGGNTSHDAGTAGGDEADGNAASAAGSAAEADIPELNGCAASDYEDRSADDADRVIEIAKMGLTFTPKCMIVALGQSVRWQGNLSAHPLAPGNPDDLEAGTTRTPIEPTTSGSEVEFTFDSVGTFPYHCTLHSFAAGQGMAGAVHVL